MGNKRQKTKWRKRSTIASADVDPEDYELTQRSAEAKAARFVKKNQAKLFRIETGPSAKGAGEARKLDKQLGPSQQEVKRIQKLKEKIQSGVKVGRSGQSAKRSSQAFDIWAVSSDQFARRPEPGTSDTPVNPAVVPPASGLSYNPKLDAHQQQLRTVIERAEVKPAAKPLPEATRRKRVVKKLDRAQRQSQEALKKAQRRSRASDQERQLVGEAVQRRAVKRERALFDNFEQTVNTLTNQVARSARQKVRSTGLLAQRAADIRAGKFTDYDLRLSKHSIPKVLEGELVLPGQLPDSLRNAGANLASNVRERFESIYRRGLIEYKPIGKAQRTAKYKVHNRRSMKEPAVSAGKRG